MAEIAKQPETGRGNLDMHLDHIADSGVTLVTAQHANIPRDLCARVVRDIQTGTNLQHKIF